MTKSPSTAKELLEFVELVSIEVYELRATRIQREGADGFEEGYEVKTAIAVEPGMLRTRFTLDFHARDADYVIDLAPRYSVENDVTLPQDVVVEFVEKVGVMAAFPFLRENLFGLATRIGAPVPVLGLLQQGGFQLSPEAPNAD